MALLILLLSSLNPFQTSLEGYFKEYTHSTGPTQDRASNPNIFSCAASGFGMAANAVSYENGHMDRTEAIARTRRTLLFYKRHTPVQNKGWLFHFHDVDGKPVYNREVSSIDTAIFYQGARYACRSLKDDDLTKTCEEMIRAIDVKFMMKESLFLHGFTWKDDQPVFFSSTWDEYNEGVLIYDLFGKPFSPTKVRTDLPLFVYYYPLAFMDEDPKYLRDAVLYQIKTYGHAGITSTDTPTGYQFYPVGFPSPLALYAAAPFSEEAAKELTKYKNPVCHGVNERTGWVSTDRIAIDEGAALLTNHGGIARRRR
jgi:hypothetical protein